MCICIYIYGRITPQDFLSFCSKLPRSLSSFRAYILPRSRSSSPSLPRPGHVILLIAGVPRVLSAVATAVDDVFHRAPRRNNIIHTRAHNGPRLYNIFVSPSRVSTDAL